MGGGEGLSPFRLTGRLEGRKMQGRPGGSPSRLECGTAALGCVNSVSLRRLEGAFRASVFVLRAGMRDGVSHPSRRPHPAPSGLPPPRGEEAHSTIRNAIPPPLYLQAPAIGLLRRQTSPTRMLTYMEYAALLAARLPCIRPIAAPVGFNPSDTYPQHVGTLVLRACLLWIWPHPGGNRTAVDTRPSPSGPRGKTQISLILPSLSGTISHCEKGNFNQHE